jgi:hypothetical protein
MQENIRGWLQLGEKNYGFQLLAKEEIFIGTAYIIQLSRYLISKFFFFRLTALSFILLIWIIV